MALLYTLPFYLTWVIPTLWQIATLISFKYSYEHDGESLIPAFPTYIMQVWLALFLPMQGFFNWLIFMFPRFQRMHADNTSLSRWLIVVKCLTTVCSSRGSRRPNSSPEAEPTAENEKDISDDESMIGDWVNSMEELVSIEDIDHLIGSVDCEASSPDDDEVRTFSA
jgi:hypothetical protein